MPHKLLKVLANTLAIIEILFVSLIGYSNALICVAILLFPFNFGSLAVKTSGIFRNFIIFHHKPSVDHALYKYCVICMVNHKYFQYLPHILAHWS